MRKIILVIGLFLMLIACKKKTPLQNPESEETYPTIVSGKVFLRADSSPIDSAEVTLVRELDCVTSQNNTSVVIKKVITDSTGSYSISFDGKKPKGTCGGNYYVYVRKDGYYYEVFVPSSIHVGLGGKQLADFGMVKI